MADPKGFSNWHLPLALLVLEGLVLGLVLWLVGEVTGLASQTAIVLGGLLVVVAAWRLATRAEARAGTGDETPERAELKPVWTVYYWIPFGVYFGAKSVYGLYEYEVGDRWWWWSVIGIPICAWCVIYNLHDLYRHRLQRSREREEKWAPWG
jgi:hypothetical protein